MIIQTGMRTDIQAFYSEWLCNRIKEGYVMVRNPYQPQQVTRYILSPSVVDLIAFCSKDQFHRPVPESEKKFSGSPSCTERKTSITWKIYDTDSRGT